MKLRSKILSYTLPLILVPFLLMALAVYYFVIRANQIQLEQQKSQVLNEVVVGIGKDVEEVRRDVNLIANVPAISEFLEIAAAENQNVEEVSARKNQAKTILELFFKQNPYYFQLSLVDKTGLEQIKFSKDPINQEFRNISNEAFFRRSLILGSVQMPVRSISSEKFATVFTQIIISEEFNGMIVLYLNTEGFERSMRPLLTRNLATFLFDDRGVVLASVVDSKDQRAFISQLDLEREASLMLSQPAKQLTARFISIEQTGYLLSIIPSESFLRVDTTAREAGENWFLGVLEVKRSTFVSSKFQAIFVSILILAIFGVLWLTSRASRQITVPLEEVSLATNRIARGESNIDLNVKTGDEVEALAEAVNRMNFELQDYQKRLVQSAKLATMGEMTSEISHEIQNRISGISLWLQHLDSEIGADDKRREYIDEVKQGLAGFMEMLSNLKQYYRTPILNLSEIDINLMVKNSLPFVQEILVKNQIEIKFVNGKDLPNTTGDFEKLKSVIINLLMNAIQSSRDEGKITIKTHFDAQHGDIKLEVIDEGNGIAEDDISKVFYPFYSTRAGGSGLGLAISSNIVSAHGGRIEVESEIGSGAKFTVFLPSAKSLY